MRGVAETRGRWIAVPRIDRVARGEDLVRVGSRPDRVDTGVEALPPQLPEALHAFGGRAEAEAPAELEPVAGWSGPLEVDHDDVVRLDRRAASGAEEPKRRPAHECDAVEAAELAREAVRFRENVVLGDAGAGSPPQERRRPS